MSYAIETLGEMLTYCRPAGSATETFFINRFIACLPGASRDVHGNWHVNRGDAPIMWSAHTDTVHRTDGRQYVCLVDGRLQLTRRSRRVSACLGADDTVGIFLLLEMLRRNIPGRYLFHFGEEIGCIGSRALADDEDYRAMLSDMRAAIAFDRKGTNEVITHQAFDRTASDDFAIGFAAQLNIVKSLRYGPSDRGIYTDTVSYARIIPECTNIAIGYEHAHSPSEYVDTEHVVALLRALDSIDTSKLPIVRDPAIDDDAMSYIDDDVYFDRFDDAYVICDGRDRFDRGRRTFEWSDDDDGRTYVDRDGRLMRDNDHLDRAWADIQRTLNKRGIID